MLQEEGEGIEMLPMSLSGVLKRIVTVWHVVVEYQNSLLWLIWGIWLLMPMVTFNPTISPNYRALILPNEIGWGIFFVTLSLVQVCMIHRPYFKIRAGLMFVDFCLWSFWTGEFMASNVAGLLGPTCFVLGWLPSFAALARLWLEGAVHGSNGQGMDTGFILAGQRCPGSYRNLLLDAERTIKATGVEGGSGSCPDPPESDRILPSKNQPNLGKS